MKLRSLKNLPVFSLGAAEIIGQVDKAVIGDDYRLAYIVIRAGEGLSLIKAEDLEIGEEAIIINDPDKIKSYQCGEELSVYDKKLSDTIYDDQGKELGYVSDFILSRHSKKIWGIELCSGMVKDLLDGRQEIPLNEVHFKSDLTGMLRNGGIDSDNY